MTLSAVCHFLDTRLCLPIVTASAIGYTVSQVESGESYAVALTAVSLSPFSAEEEYEGVDRMSKHRTAVVLGILGILAVISAIFFGFRSSEKDDAVVWGRADAKEIDINSKVPGRVVRLLVSEGDCVEAGQVIAVMDQRDLTAQKAQLEANIEALRAQQAQAAATTAMQAGTAHAALVQAQSVQDKARADLILSAEDDRRYAALVDAGAVSQQVYAQYQAKHSVAEAAYAQAAGSVAEAQSREGVTAVNRANEAATEKRLAQAEAQLEQILISLDESEIKAPFSGIITKKYVEEGSMISNGTPLVALQDPMDNWVDIKIPETQLGRFQLGDTVEMAARDGVTKVMGTITDISRKPEFATQRATSERGDDTDIISFNVKIRVNEPAVRPGMRFRLMGRTQ